MRRIFTATVFVTVLLALSQNVFAQSESRDDLLKQIEAKRAELTLLEKQLLEPSEQDRIAYADFLQQPNTGIARLLPREKHDDQAYQDLPKSGITIRGGGAYYSFTRLSHEYGNGTQIGFEQGQLSTSFAGADYGMLANLGDVPLEAVSLEHPTVKFLASYESASEEPQARSEYTRFRSGVSIDGVSYKTRLPGTIDNSYVLRGIHYSDSDVLVAFRVVRKDTDGSVIIVWKLLKKYPTPKLARNN